MNENVHGLWKFLMMLAIAVIFIPEFVMADSVPLYSFSTPVFGLTSVDGILLAADSGSGVVRLRKGEWKVIADLLAVSDMSSTGKGQMFAVTGAGDAPTARKFFRISHKGVEEIADLLAFETNVNPDGGLVDSNPFDVEMLSGNKALVADAGGNDLLIVDKKGRVDWVATLPDELVPTDNIKTLVGCPNPAPGFEFACGLPDMMPAQGVATSIAIGRDGAYYVGELKGFPAPTGMSRIWRIEPGTLHAQCGTSPACSIVASGFTSIVDLTFGKKGQLYVVELDEASWAAVEFGIGSQGGTINSCDSSNWNCTVVATGLPIPMATAVDRHGTLFALIWALVPGSAQVITLP